MSPDFFNLGNPPALQWLWLLLPLAVLFVYDLLRRQRVLRIFVSQSLLDDVSPRRSLKKPIFKFLILAAGLALLIFALARPRWDPSQIELQQQGHNLLFCLDVSNSMRARDVDPSRLEAAKAAIRTMIDQLPAGNQVGLLAYAGNAELKCTLTPNYRHMISVINNVTCNSVDVGGSNLGDAVYKATHDVFGLTDETLSDDPKDKQEKPSPTTQMAIEAEQPDQEKKANVLIVLTDGESHEGHAREMAHEAHRLGVAIYIIGIGTEAGGPIPLELDGKVTNMKYKGQEVITRYDDASLRSVVEGLGQRCGYLAAGASNVDLIDVYKRVIAQQKTETKSLRYTVWQEKFQLFVGIGLILIILSSLISDQGPARKGGAL
ncbi:MAG: vWA domain-containing protein [Planctomycetota bacterium]|jgi:Ca-activated chloride channel family protein